MNLSEKFIAAINWELLFGRGLRVLVIIIIGWIITKLLTSGLQRFETKLVSRATQRGESPFESQKRIETIVRLIKQGGLLTIWITMAMVILREFGIDIGPIIASAGIVGLAVGFGAQNLVRDFISGFFIILENQIRVGDVAVINGTGGLVEKINFRTTVLRDVGGVVHYFPNGTITTLSNLTNDWSAYVFEVGVAYKENTDDVIDVMSEVGQKLVNDEYFGPLILAEPEIFGVDKLDDSAVVIKGRIKTKPIKQWEVGREYLRRIKHAFDANEIEIPFPHSTVYFGDAGKPLDIQLTEMAKRQQAAASSES